MGLIYYLLVCVVFVGGIDLAAYLYFKIFS